MTFFADTSAILHNCFLTYPNGVVCALTIQELEGVKGSTTADEKVKAIARHFCRGIINKNIAWEVNIPKRWRIAQFFRTHKEMMKNNDGEILAAAYLVFRKDPDNFTFITSDNLQYLFAKSMFGEHRSILWEEPKSTSSLWKGWTEYSGLSDEITAALYSEPENNILGAKTHEFCKIMSNGEVTDVLVWNGKKYRPIIYKSFKSPLGEKISPRNLEQKMAFDMLQDKMPIKLLTGRFGTGKVFASL